MKISSLILNGKEPLRKGKGAPEKEDGKELLSKEFITDSELLAYENDLKIDIDNQTPMPRMLNLFLQKVMFFKCYIVMELFQEIFNFISWKPAIEGRTLVRR